VLGESVDRRSWSLINIKRKMARVRTSDFEIGSHLNAHMFVSSNEAKQKKSSPMEALGGMGGIAPTH
jgi:hypothetical protein